MDPTSKPAVGSKSQRDASISHIEFKQDIKVLPKNLGSSLRKRLSHLREWSAQTNHLGEQLAFILSSEFPGF